LAGPVDSRRSIHRSSLEFHCSPSWPPDCNGGGLLRLPPQPLSVPSGRRLTARERTGARFQLSIDSRIGSIIVAVLHTRTPSCRIISPDQSAIDRHGIYVTEWFHPRLSG